MTLWHKYGFVETFKVADWGPLATVGRPLANNRKKLRNDSAS